MYRAINGQELANILLTIKMNQTFIGHKCSEDVMNKVWIV